MVNRWKLESRRLKRHRLFAIEVSAQRAHLCRSLNLKPQTLAATEQSEMLEKLNFSVSPDSKT
jgi:hypothetical protein